jgi:hypothetical protein
MLTLFGFIAASIMMLSYAFESRSKWLILVFAIGSAATAVYSALADAYPITVIEAIWSVIAARRFMIKHKETREPDIR